MDETNLVGYSFSQKSLSKIVFGAIQIETTIDPRLHLFDLSRMNSTSILLCEQNNKKGFPYSFFDIERGLKTNLFSKNIKFCNNPVVLDEYKLCFDVKGELFIYDRRMGRVASCLTLDKDVSGSISYTQTSFKLSSTEVVLSSGPYKNECWWADIRREGVLKYKTKED